LAGESLRSCGSHHPVCPSHSLSWQAHINQTFNLSGQGDCSLQKYTEEEKEEEEDEDEGKAARERKRQTKRVLLQEIYQLLQKHFRT
jgi:hypothetical protein